MKQAIGLLKSVDIKFTFCSLQIFNFLTSFLPTFNTQVIHLPLSDQKRGSHKQIIVFQQLN